MARYFLSAGGPQPIILYRGAAPKPTHTCSFFDQFADGQYPGAIGQCQCGQYAVYKFGWRLISEKKANKLLIKAGVREDNRGVRGGKQPPNPPPRPKSQAHPPSPPPR